MNSKPVEASQEAGGPGGPAAPLGVPGSAVRISDRAWYVDAEGVRTVYVGSATVLVMYTLGDKVGRDYAMAQLSRSKYATQAQVAAAFGVCRATVNRVCRRLDQGGIGGLARKTRHDKTPGAVATKVCQLRRAGLRIREIARQTRISGRTVRTILTEAGLSAYDAPVARQLRLEEQEEDAEATEADPEEGPGETPEEGAAESVEAEEPPVVVEGAAEEIHALERALAPTGKVEEATVIFSSGERVSGAGVLLALGLAGGPLLQTAREVYGKLRNGFYGLRTTVLGLLAMACVGVRNGESLQHTDPVDLGRLLGLDRVFEVKTLRRKLREIQWLGKAAAWHRRLTAYWVSEEDSLATLYVDGHTRAYYGKKQVAKGWVARRRLCQAGTSETWVHTVRGEPLLRVTEEAHPALSKALPGIVKDVRALLGEAARPTVAFDRGGWSGATFRKLVESGFDFATYQKGAFEPLPAQAFQVHELEGREYRLTEDRVTIRGYGEARRIIELCDSGKQVPLVTNKETVPAAEAVRDLLGRWRQENCFKYLRQHYNLDAVVDYGQEAVPDREIPNPARKALNKELGKLQTELKKLQVAYAKCRNDRKERKRLAAAMRKQEKQLDALTQKRNALPTRVLLSQSERADEVQLSPERKLFTDLVKMAAYRVDSALVDLLGGHFARHADEGHAFVRAVFRQPADLQVSGNHVTVLFEPISAPRFTRALSGLCEAVNATNPTFPETRYRLHFGVKQPSEL